MNTKAKRIVNKMDMKRNQGPKIKKEQTGLKFQIETFCEAKG